MYLPVFLAFASVVKAAAPTVTLGSTTLVGRDVTGFQQDFFGGLLPAFRVLHLLIRRLFVLGIPFAKAPIGELRLQPPVKAELSAGSFDASNFSLFCLQPVSIVCLREESKFPPLTMLLDALFIQGFNLSQTSEDCLTINVYRPSNVTSAGTKVPVLFWYNLYTIPNQPHFPR